MADPLFLLDTNVCIYILDDARSASALRVQQHRPGMVVTSAIVAAEILRGMRSDADMQTAVRLFSVIPIIPFDMDAAQAYGRLPFRRGRVDRLIGAHTLALGLTLVTNNEADFADIAGLRIENWTLPLDPIA